jgi:putative SOS response-associated peptidase YedK
VCGRFAASAAADQVVALFEIDEVLEVVKPSYNVAPTQQLNIVLQRVGQRRRLLASANWGLVPSWAKDRTGASRLINARAETLTEKPSFRAAFAARRCLIPADGYYEWAPAAAGSGGRRPFFIRPADGGLLALAGLYEYWRQPDGEWLTTATVVTTAATDQLRALHHRMPMLVAPQHWDRWLDPGAPGIVDWPDSPPKLELHPVATLVNHVANDGPELIERQAVQAPELP